MHDTPKILLDEFLTGLAKLTTLKWIQLPLLWSRVRFRYEHCDVLLDVIDPHAPFDQFAHVFVGIIRLRVHVSLPGFLLHV